MQHLFRRAILVIAALSLLPVQAVGATTYVTSSSFSSATNGLVSGWNTDNTTFVSVTSDGGQTFVGTEPNAITPADELFNPLGAVSSGSDVFTFADWIDRPQHSANSGASWQFLPGLMTDLVEAIPTQPTMPRAMTVFSNGRMAVAGFLNGNSGVEGKQPAFLLTSDDEGQTWSSTWPTEYGPLYPKPNPDDPPPTPLSSFLAMDVDPTGNYGWAVGSEGKSVGGVPVTPVPMIRKTADAGSTWTTQTANGLGLTHLSEVSASSSQIVFAIDSGRNVIRSSNGGTTWIKDTIDYDYTRPVVNNIMYARAIDSTGTRVVVAGMYGKIAYTPNGLTADPVWTHYNVLSGVSFTGVKMISDTEWVVFGDNETIARTTNAGSSWTVQSGGVPSAAITSPSAGFLTNASPVTISGTSSDIGLGVKKVEVQARTSSGLYYNAVTDAWQAAEAWMPATTLNGWKNWSAEWAFTPAEIPAGNLVTVRARATDVTGKTGLSTTVASGLPPAPAVGGVIAMLSDYTAATTVPVAISSTNAVKMRWNAGSSWSAWANVSTEANVTLPSGDGAKTVTFEFSSDSVSPSAEATATDQIILDTTGPQLTWSNPAAGFNLTTAAAVPISGTFSDAGSGVGSVQVSILNNGRYWNGTAWVPEATWLDASVTDGAWNYTWEPDATVKASWLPVTVSVKASDALGNTQSQSRVSEDPLDPTAITLTSKSAILAYGGVGYVKGILTSAGSPISGTVQIWQRPYNRSYYTLVTNKPVYSSGAFAVGVKPSVKTYYQVRFVETATKKASVSSVLTFNPRAYLTTPYAPSSVRRGARFTAYGYLKPAHTAGTYAVRIYRERYVSGRWVSYGYVLASSYKYYSYTKYARTLSLPYAGIWRLRAYHYDTGHAPTYSSYRTVRVY